VFLYTVLLIALGVIVLALMIFYVMAASQREGEATDEPPTLNTRGRD
jgi:hypothetical protein